MPLGLPAVAAVCGGAGVLCLWSMLWSLRAPPGGPPGAMAWGPRGVRASPPSRSRWSSSCLWRGACLGWSESLRVRVARRNSLRRDRFMQPRREVAHGASFAQACRPLIGHASFSTTMAATRPRLLAQLAVGHAACP